MSAKKGLGKGLGALLNTEESVETFLNEKTITELRLSQIEPNRNQPRTEFDAAALAELADSIRQYGVISPIIVKRLDNGFYRIIAGERRWRAAREAQLVKIPAIIRDYDDKETMEIALVENLQREDLNPLEEAFGISELMTAFSLTQDEVSKRVGRSRSAIANSLRLLSLCDEIKEMLVKKELSAGHARALLALSDKDLQLFAAKKIIEEKLSVRQAEALATTLTKKPHKKSISKEDEEIKRYFSSLEKKLSTSFGTSVHIKNKSVGGKIEIEYYNNEDFERIMQKFEA